MEPVYDGFVDKFCIAILLIVSCNYSSRADFEERLHCRLLQVRVGLFCDYHAIIKKRRKKGESLAAPPEGLAIVETATKTLVPCRGKVKLTLCGIYEFDLKFHGLCGDRDRKSVV